MPEYPAQDASRRESYASQKKVEVEEMELANRSGVADYASRPTFAEKTKRHCTRWWWLHLIIFCSITLITSLLLVYVAMPKISQKGVDDSSIQFTSLKFSNPTPNTFTLSQTAILYSPSIFTPVLDSYNASLFLVTDGTASTRPYATFPMPAIHVAHPQGDVNFTDILVTVDDVEALGTFSSMVLGLENLTTAVGGTTTLRLGKLPPVSVTSFLQSTMKGLDGLAGFNVTKVKITSLKAAIGQPNLQGFVYIHNPSVMTIDMGEVVMSVYIPTVGYVGNTTIPNMTIVPGDNYLNMTGILDQQKVLGAVDKSTGMVQLLISGQSSVYKGQHLPYYEKALSSKNLTLPLNVSQVLLDSGIV